MLYGLKASFKIVKVLYKLASYLIYLISILLVGTYTAFTPSIAFTSIPV